jgi:hypothetical protein
MNQIKLDKIGWIIPELRTGGFYYHEELLITAFGGVISDRVVDFILFRA